MKQTIFLWNRKGISMAESNLKLDFGCTLECLTELLAVSLLTLTVCVAA